MKVNAPSPQSPSASATAAEELLSPVRAFVVQFRTTSGGPKQPFRGRVEHMTSGQVLRFSSSGELLSFFERVLAGVTEKGD
jgi:hypothetical protein